MARRERGKGFPFPLLADTRGESETTAWLLAQMPFWFMATMVILVAMLGLRQSGTASVAHLAAREAGTTNLAAGYNVAQRRGDAWGIPAETARLSLDVGHRSVVMQWAYDWYSRSVAGGWLGRAFRVDVTTVQRMEAFYAGPPDEWD